MTIQTTRWSPDTCTCVLEYTWDDTLPNDQITPTYSNTISKCPDHSSQSGDTLFNIVNEENPRKNITLQMLLDNGPSTLYDLVGGTTRVLKKNIGFNFSWSGTAPNRVLTVSFTGITLTNAQKNTAQSVLNTRFGIGKVVLVVA
jgi:hypothetical protein